MASSAVPLPSKKSNAWQYYRLKTGTVLKKRCVLSEIWAKDIITCMDDGLSAVMTEWQLAAKPLELLPRHNARKVKIQWIVWTLLSLDALAILCS